MRAMQAMTEALGWRWMPAVGLSAGAFLFAVSVALVMPPMLGGGGANALVIAGDDDDDDRSSTSKTMRPPPKRTLPKRPMERARPAFAARAPVPARAPAAPPAPRPAEVAPPPPPSPPPPPRAAEPPPLVPAHDREALAAQEAGRKPAAAGVVTPRALAAPLRVLKPAQTPPPPSKD